MLLWFRQLLGPGGPPWLLILMAALFEAVALRLVEFQLCLGALERQRQKLEGRKLDDAALHDAAEAAFAQAQPREHNAFKVQLGKLTLIRALRKASTMEL